MLPKTGLVVLTLLMGCPVARAQTSNVPPVDVVPAVNAQIKARNYQVVTESWQKRTTVPNNDPFLKEWCVTQPLIGTTTPVDTGGFAPCIPGQACAGVTYLALPPQYRATDLIYNKVEYCKASQTYEFYGSQFITPQVSKVHILTASPPTFGPAILNALPVITTGDGATYLNCGNTALNNTISLALATAKTVSITTTKTVANAGTFTLTFAEKLGDTTLGANIAFSDTKTTAVANQNQTVTTTTSTATSMIAVPPMSAYSVVVQVHPVSYTQTANSNITVDGDFASYNCLSTQKFCARKISDIVPPLSPFPVQFELTSNDSSKTTITGYTLPLEPSDCSGSGVEGEGKLKVVKLRTKTVALR